MAKQHFDAVFQFEKVTDKEIGENGFNLIGSGDGAYLRVPTSIGVVAAHKGDWLAKGDNGWHVYRDDPRQATIPAHAGEPQPDAGLQHVDSAKPKVTNQPLSAIGEQTGTQQPTETADKAVVSEKELQDDAQIPDKSADKPVLDEPKKKDAPKKAAKTTNQPLSAIGEQTGKQP